MQARGLRAQERSIPFHRSSDDFVSLMVGRDCTYSDAWSSDGTAKVLTVWIPVTDVTVDNGCMFVIPREFDENVSHAVLQRPSLVAICCTQWTRTRTRVALSYSDPLLTLTYNTPQSTCRLMREPAASTGTEQPHST